MWCSYSGSAFPCLKSCRDILHLRKRAQCNNQSELRLRHDPSVVSLSLSLSLYSLQHMMNFASLLVAAAAFAVLSIGIVSAQLAPYANGTCVERRVSCNIRLAVARLANACFNKLYARACYVYLRTTTCFYWR